MQVTIRQENNKDYPAVFSLIKKAFNTEEDSKPQEQFLVEKLRKSKVFIPKLSLVAEIDNTVVGHILLTKIEIKNKSKTFNSLALAPVSVLPEFQNMGIGGQLITQVHKIAVELGYASIILLGHENYYPKFGYVQAHTFNIEIPFEAPKENCMAIELIPNGLEGVSGIVKYPKEFYE